VSDDVFSKAGRKLQFGASTHQCLYDRERRTVQVRIPVAVREDGAVFVWEMDGSDPKRRHSAGPALSSRRPDRLYYYDLDGKTPSDDGEHRWGNVNVHWVTAAVPLPAPADHVTHGRVE
jgi:hypothetical protein